MTRTSVLQQELRDEQAYVDRVIAELGRAVASAKDLASESRARFTSDRETWVRDDDGTALFERDAFAFLAARRMADLDGEHEGLVFGRLDFRDRETRYVGRLGVRTVDYEPLVIDWRAQAAEPFYRSTPVYPLGVVRRRVLTSRDDKVTGIEDDVLMPNEVPDDMAVIGDGALMRALGRARGARMHDIVSTIQSEQDEAIRADYQGFTIINGGPGTGKTVVGLHRIAYLLYAHRRRFANGGVLIVGPSSVFMDYIGRVLPSLGEDSVTLRSVGEVATDALGLSSSTRESDEAWAIKGSPTMVSVLRHIVQDSPTPDPLTVVVEGEPRTISVHELAHIRRESLAQIPYNQARHLAETHIVAFLRDIGADESGLTEQRREERIRDSWAFRTFMDQWWPILTPTEVLCGLRNPEAAIHAGMDPTSATTLASAITPEKWTIGDIPLLDELAQLLGPVPREEDSESLFASQPVSEVVTISERLTDSRVIEEGVPHSTYAHILVDEAQDITPMQWRMIHRRGPQASWTILSDPAQSSWPDPEEPTRVLASVIGSRQRRRFTLSTNYRSPKESYDLACAYILRTEPEADIPRAVRLVGRPPRMLVAAHSDLAATVGREVDTLLEDVDGTVGVIATPQFHDIIRAELPTDERVILLDPFSAKGLEFDAVVVADPDSIASNERSGARTLYVALTRPTRLLVTIDVDHAGTWRDGISLPQPGFTDSSLLRGTGGTV